MTSDDSKAQPAAKDEEHPLLEAFNAEEAVEHPGDLDEEPDTTDDADAPAP